MVAMEASVDWMDVCFCSAYMPPMFMWLQGTSVFGNFLCHGESDAFYIAGSGNIFGVDRIDRSLNTKQWFSNHSLATKTRYGRLVKLWISPRDEVVCIGLQWVRHLVFQEFRVKVSFITLGKGLRKGINCVFFSSKVSCKSACLTSEFTTLRYKSL